MVKHIFCAFMLVFPSIFVFSQSRTDTLVFIPELSSGTARERRFFEENLRMEISAMGYSITEESLKADYTLSCSISDDEKEPGRVVSLTLFDTGAEREIITSGLTYKNEMEETYETLPYLLWSIFANAPLKQGDGEAGIFRLPGEAGSPDAWKHRWVFINARLGPSFRYYRAGSSDNPSTSILTFDAGVEPEVRFFNFLALQPGINFTLDKVEYQRSRANPTAITYSTALLSIPLSVKYIFNPADRFALGLYLGGYANIPLLGASKPPLFGILAGLDLGVKTWAGVLLFDFRYSIDLGTTKVFDSAISYNRMFITLSAGYKFGLMKR
jgi:hypothetical protein